MHVALRNIFLVCMYNVHAKLTSLPLPLVICLYTLCLCLPQHPSIVSLHYAFQTNHKLYLILEYLRGKWIPSTHQTALASQVWYCRYCRCLSKMFRNTQYIFACGICTTFCTIYKLDAESRELRDLESRGPDVASRA